MRLIFPKTQEFCSLERGGIGVGMFQASSGHVPGMKNPSENQMTFQGNFLLNHITFIQRSLLKEDGYVDSAFCFHLFR
jgi:hypothetical protein